MLPPVSSFQVSIDMKKEVLDWGIRLTVQPFAKTQLDSVKIQSEVFTPKPGHGPGVKITIIGLSPASPMKLLDAQALQEALGVVVAETRLALADMRQ